jgi:hypothetical protein
MKRGLKGVLSEFYVKGLNVDRMALRNGVILALLVVLKRQERQ